LHFSQEIGWKDYSRGIFRVEGFSQSSYTLIITMFKACGFVLWCKKNNKLIESNSNADTDLTSTTEVYTVGPV